MSSISGRPRPAPRHLRGVIAAGVALAACAAGITGYAVTRSHGTGAAPAAASNAPSPTARPSAPVDQAALAARILQNAATQVARGGVTAEPRPGQWIYSKTVEYEYPGGMQPVSGNWMTFDGSQSAYFQGKQLLTHTSPITVPGSRVSAWAAWRKDPGSYTAYRLLKSLPADPRALLSIVGTYVREEGISNAALGNPLQGILTPTTLAQAQFDLLTDVLWNAAGAVGGPLAAEVAVFRAMAMLPGISVQQGVTDVAGAPAIAVSDDGYDQILLDASTYQVLGMRELFRGPSEIPVTENDIPAKYLKVWRTLSKAEQDKIIAQAQQKLAKTWPARGAVLDSFAYAKVAEVKAPGDR